MHHGLHCQTLVRGLLFGWLAVCLPACGTSRQSVGLDDNGLTEVSLTDDEQRKFSYYFIEALRLKQSNEYDAALEMYEHCLSIDPTSASVLFDMAHFYLMIGLNDKAQQTFEQVVELNPDNFWYRQTLAALYQRFGQIDKAIAVYEDMTHRFPDHSESLMTLVTLYEQQHDYAKEIAVLDKLELKNGKSEMLTMQKFRIYLQMKQPEEAFREIEGLIAEYPNDARYKLVLSNAYMSNGRLDDARKTLDSVLAEDPNNPSAQLAMAEYYQRMGNDSLYRMELNRALLNAQLDTETRVNLVRKVIVDTEQQGGDSARVIDLFHKTLPLETEKADLGMLYTQYMITKKMPDDSIKVSLRHILHIEPDNTAARMQLLSYAVKNNDYQEAVEICEPALEYDADKLEFYYYLGISYFMTDRSDEALSVFIRGVEHTTPETDKELVSDFYGMIGDIYHNQKQAEQAYAAYDSALVYKPDNIVVLNNYAYYLSLEQKDLDRAEEMSFRTVQAEPKNGTYLDTYAWILFEKGRYSEARIYIDQAMQNGGNESAVVVEHCGDIYYMLGQHDKALELWKQAASMEDNESKTLNKKIRLKKYVTE